MAARSYSHVSNRAKARTAIERRGVSKSVIDNPFRIQWPSIPPSAQNMFLVTLLTSFESTVKRRTPKTAKAGALPQFQTSALSEESCSKSSPPCSAIENPASPFDYITIGINQVTRSLESQVKYFRKSATLTTASCVSQISAGPASIAVVFVCRADVNPPILLDHIPHLVAGCNSTRPRSEAEGAWRPVKLITLPKDSESALARALGLRRAAVIAIHVSARTSNVSILTFDTLDQDDAPFLPTFYEMLQSVPVISAPWLVPPFQHASPRSLIPTHIKQLRTSAPKDMKAAKEQRTKARAAAKKTSAKLRPKKRVMNP
ncbi:RNase P subunit Pop3 [Rhizopogon vesiculosus]|uniref:RNase P subunit Pop3 n=1 Tax=Rhizopogon vesiculosus TaxID=180088 RepID=A0A1J8QF56_9AGAM|nr:RNase P subunit Pop3 [Rhizopogon vesiculosus]